MSVSESTLIEALHRRADKDVEAVWQAARADAEKFRSDIDHAIEEKRARSALSISAATEAFSRQAAATAERQARKLHAAAKAKLAARLFSIAVDALKRFRQESYEELFSALASELPPGRWQRVSVNPEDRNLAAKCFPEALISSDEAITGGIDVQSEDGSIRISNTLETRLQAAWPDLLPDLMASVRRELPHL